MLWAAGLADSGAPHNANPARVINMSLGGQGSCDASYADVFNQLSAANVVVVVAAGNDEGLAVSAPANCTGAIAVSGLRHAGTKVGFSDIGPQTTISAPAGNCVNATGACLYPIITATNTGTTTPVTSPAGQTYSDGLNRIAAGTSFSAPLVSGTVALMLSANPALTNAQVKAALQGSARAFPFRGALADPGSAAIQACHAPNTSVQDQCYCTTSTCGAGMLDAASAVAAARGLQPQITVSASPKAGIPVTLSNVGTTLPTASGHTWTWQWSLVDGGGIVDHFDTADNASTAALTPTAAGQFSVRLTYADGQGFTGSAEETIAVAVAPGTVVTPPTTPTTPPTTPSSGGGGGGGAISPAFLLLLAAAATLLWWARRRQG
jgi:serine protease